MIKNAIIIFWSKTGNTEKVAYSIKEALAEEINVEIKQVQEAENVNFFDYDLVCIGCRSQQWSPPEEIDDYLHNKYSEYSDKVKLGAPKVKGRNALILCTYSGPHTGKNEVIPVGKYIGQFFEHLGFKILDEIFVLSEHHGSKEVSTNGKMGDIRDLPTAEDLKEVKNKVKNL